MGPWSEKEWRNPKRGEVVRDEDGNLGVVTLTQGDLNKRRLWVSNVSGTEIHTGAESEKFDLVDRHVTRKFHLERMSIKGLKEGALCSFNGNLDVPLEIMAIEWNGIKDIPLFCLRDMREVVDNIFKTYDENLIKVFDLNLPPLEGMFSKEDSGLKWRLQVDLVEVQNPGWSGCGSPWEFRRKEDALTELENWRSRLLIRRVASVINSDWKIQFPCWSIEMMNESSFRIKRVDALVALPVYFPSALHAATAIKLVPVEHWNRVFMDSYDEFY